MASQIASILCLLLIIFLHFLDRHNNALFSKALWIPFIWIFFSYSDRILSWLHIDISGLANAANSIEEGNPFNRTVYIILIIFGIYILSKRNTDWADFFTSSKCVWLYFIVGLFSCFWSDYTFISFKRLIKASGVPIMALVILTEKRPYIALGLILKRLSFILLPISVLFIKYYPTLGRAYHMGEPMYTGVADHKNGLGALCLMAGIYFFWNVFYGRRIPDDRGQRLHILIYIIIFPMIAWLVYMANSATSIACLIVTIALFAIARHKRLVERPGNILVYGITAVVLIGIFQITTDLKGIVVNLLGRSETLTNRTDIWQYLLGMAQNPAIGTGYESFWLGPRLNTIQERWGNIIQAHNGYLEMYLNMGLIGLIFILSWIFLGIANTMRHLKMDYPTAILKLCLIIIPLLYNYTEATFYGVISMWILFFVGILKIPTKKQDSSPDYSAI